MERLLHGMERLAIARQAFDRRHVVALGLYGKHQARPHRHSVEEHGATAAHAVLAADMRAGEPEVVAEMVG